jgi:hypothetical protein
MSCGTKSSGKFSSQKNTYSYKSDLTMSNWDPYPELQNPKNINYEPYCMSDACRGSAYKTSTNNLDSMASYAPLQKSRVVSFEEKYCRDCDPTPYDTLQNTWTVQPQSKEKYCRDCDPTPYNTLQNTWTVQGKPQSKEKYCISCDATPYDTLQNTWVAQGPYRT